jgi:glycosyltransferase involved in cell wall biosynthesis
MKKLLLFLLLLSVSFAGGFAAARWRALRSLQASSQESLLDNRFQPAPFSLKKRPFAILIQGRNNGAFVEKTLRSALTQAYDNFRLLYVDDASDDGSFEFVRDFLNENKHLLKVSLHRNEKPIGPLGCLALLIRECEDEEIAVVLEGRDWLAHEWVLQKLNEYYSDPDLWLSYGQSRSYPNFQMGASRPFSVAEWKNLRASPFMASHLKTFYAKLFKKIDEADLQLKGEYLKGASELAYMFPMLEMAESHFQYIPDILYISNSESPFEERDASIEKMIRSSKPYAPLDPLFLKPATGP